MKFNLSIKLFISISILFLMLGLSLVFYNFYTSSKASTEALLRSSVQSNVFNLKHYLDSNMKTDKINEIKSHLDAMCSVSDILEDIYIYDQSKKAVYSSNRNPDKKYNDSCVAIFEISDEKMFERNCYSIKTKFYNKLTPFHYETNIYLSDAYLDSLLYDQTVELFVQYIISMFFLLFLGWVIISKIIKNPLEKLRQYAYYENRAPSEFFIQEIESIRYSLMMTFKRLHQEQQELYKLSTRDQLSGLYNKRSLIEKIEWLISAKTKRKERLAVIFLDLDNFKNINDSLGHNVGDKVLQQVSKFLLKNVRKNDIVSRIGGDEFVVVLPEIDSDTRIIEILQAIKTQIPNSVVLDNKKYQITVSMGIAIYPKDGTDANTLLRHADIAMYKSKELGKNNYNFFTDSFNKDIQAKFTMQNLLVDALENNYFKLFYQPKINIKTKKISSCEALIRLDHPQKGLIPPNDFITIAEENNFIIPLGYWVIAQSVRQLKAWQETEFKDIKISINLSVKQFQDSQLIVKLKELTADIDRSKLDIELTESIFIDSNNYQNIIIQQIKKLGFTLSLDDFGTGYSSLSYLKNIPFNTLKIDKTFIDDLEMTKGKEFVKMIVNIAKTLNLYVVAEGVETEKQKDFLEAIECDSYQGYLCSKPLPWKDFEELLKSNNYL